MIVFDARARYHEALDLILDPNTHPDARPTNVKCASMCWGIMVRERQAQVDLTPSDVEPA